MGHAVGIVVLAIAGVLLLSPIVGLMLRFNRYVRHDGASHGLWKGPDGAEYNIESDI